MLDLHPLLRRERDSNPRNLSVQRFSRPPQSTTLPSLLFHLVSHLYATVWNVFSLILSNLLSGKDSNPHRRNQNPKCYHYTTGQAFRLRSANLQLFLLLVSYCVIKIILLIFIHNCISVHWYDTRLTLMTTTWGLLQEVPMPHYCKRGA